MNCVLGGNDAFAQYRSALGTAKSFYITKTETGILLNGVNYERVSSEGYADNSKTWLFVLCIVCILVVLLITLFFVIRFVQRMVLESQRSPKRKVVTQFLDYLDK